MTGDIIVGAASQGHDLLDWATPIFTLLGVVVVALYTNYAKKQWEEGKKSNKNFLDSMELSHRAWVICKIVEPESMPIATPKTVMTVFENTGSTPASHVVIRYGWTLTSDRSIPEHLPEDHMVTEIVGILGNGHTYKTRTHVRQFTSEEFNNRTNTFWLVYGTIDYRDVFGKERRTVYCKRYDDVGWAGTTDEHNSVT